MRRGVAQSACLRMAWESDMLLYVTLETQRFYPIMSSLASVLPEIKRLLVGCYGLMRELGNGDETALWALECLL